MMANKNKSKFKSKNKPLKKVRTQTKKKNKKPNILLNYKDKLIKEKIKNIIRQGGVQEKKENLKNQNKKNKFAKKSNKPSKIILNPKERFIRDKIIGQDKNKPLKKVMIQTKNKGKKDVNNSLIKQTPKIILNPKERLIKDKIIKQNGIVRAENLKQNKNLQKDNLGKKIFTSKRLDKKEIMDFSEKVRKIKQEIGKVVVGQEKVINGLIRALICNGHVILEGVPGIAKTLLIRSLGRVSGCNVKRIQFTVDLLPTDIIGLTIYRDKLGFEVVKGPIFANFVITDEINRAPPKTQSALLEAMQEKQITIGRKTFLLPKPFFVMATKNPIEAAGVYALPEAQVDRFLFKLLIKYPQIEEEKLIMKKNIDSQSFNDFNLQQIISPMEIMKMQSIVKEIYLSQILENYIVNIVDYTRNKKNKHAKYIEWGASPRASIAFFMASKAEALMKGRSFVVPEDVKTVALDILRHRLILSYEAEANNITVDSLITNILNEIQI